MTEDFEPDYFEEDEEGQNFYFREDDLFEGGWELETINGLDLILDPGEDQERVVSTVLDMRTGEVILLRQGVGVWPA